MAAIAKFVSYDGGIAFSAQVVKIQKRGQDPVTFPIEDVVSVRVRRPQEDTDGFIFVEEVDGRRYRILFEDDQVQEAIQFKKQFDATAFIEEASPKKHASSPKKNKGPILILVSAFIVVILVVSLFLLLRNNGSSSTDLESYKETASYCRNNICTTTDLIKAMAEYESNYFDALKNIRGNTAISDGASVGEEAFEWLAEESGVTVENLKILINGTHDTIQEEYKEIALADVNGKEVEQIGPSIKEMYEAFISLYDMVTVPTGDMSSFSTNCDSYISTISSADANLSLFLGSK